MTVSQETQSAGPDPNRSPERRNRDNQRSENRQSTAEQRRIREEVENYQSNKDQMDDEQKSQVKETVTRNLKEDIAMKNRDAEMASKTIEMNGGQVADNVVNEANNIEETVRLFVRAAKEGLVSKPDDPTSAVFFDKLVNSLAQGFNNADATYFQPLINGLLNTPNYISFSKEGESEKAFESDLKRIVGTGRGGSFAERVLTDILNQMRAEGHDVGISQEQFEEKKTVARQKRTEEVTAQREQIKEAMEDIQGQSDFTRQEDRYLASLIEKGGAEDPDAQIAAEMLRSMESPERFKQFYKNRYDHMLQTNEKVTSIADPERRRDRAAKETTHEINKTLLYMVHKIFAPVIDGGSKKPFAQLVQDASSGYMLNPQTVFYNLKKKIMYLSHPISERDTHWEEEGMKFYQYKNTKKKVWVPVNKEGSDELKKGATSVLGKFVEETESMELRESSFKEFLENMYLSIDAEKDLLETGINFNYLMATGQTTEQQSFFQQAAQYAKQTLPANRLDELYKLPFADLVEAAKIQLSSYYKKKFAMNHWRKDPEILLGLFENMNEVEDEALKDMIHNFGELPEWVIKRALIHARMHLSLVNLEMHALSSYAHATIDDLANPTYRDQSLKNLDVFKTWYSAEMWQVSDMFVKGMAFMPQPNRDWKIKDWVHEDITAEGRDIYEQSFLLGNMAAVDRKNYKDGMLPNIMELNPMKNGGVEIQLGWRMKYAMYPWIQDMLDVLNNENKLKLDSGADAPGKEFEHGWKRLENISANVLKIFRDEFLFEGEYLEQGSDGTVANEKQYENFFKFLYKRYLSDGLGKKGFNYGNISSEEDFWRNVIQPILHKKPRQGEGEAMGDAVKRNTNARIEELKEIVNQALTVVAFERVPMDFVFMESSARSQNGVTLLQELQDYFSKTDDKELKMDVQELDRTFDDILFVQQKARTESIDKMNDHIRRQTDRGGEVKVLYGDNLASLDEVRSDIEIVAGQEKKGYAIAEDVIEKVLQSKYDKIPNLSDEEKKNRVKRAVEVFKKIKERMMEKPDMNPHERDPHVTDTRFKMKLKMEGINPNDKVAVARFKDKSEAALAAEFKKYRDEKMTTRLLWSKEEVVGPTTAMPINDTAYQYLELVKGGKDMVQRSISAVQVQQERYKNDVAGGGLLSALKKYYRKDDLEALHELITEMRSSIKEENEDASNEMALRVLENAINVMRINSDAENLLVEGQYMAHHRHRAAFSTVVKEGPEFPLHREDRYQIVRDFLHYSQFPKRVKGADQKYDELPSFEEKWDGNLLGFGNVIGRVADGFFGTEDGRLVRARWKEMSGEGLRDREIASMMNIVVREGPKYFVVLLIAVLVLTAAKGYQDNEES